MLCGNCQQSFETFQELKKHWKETGCNWGRPVWERYTRAKKRGTSGRRVLTEGFPHLYPKKPMSEEAKACFAELHEKRKGMKVSRRSRRKIKPTRSAKRRR